MPTLVRGIKFASKAESRRYIELLALQQTGQIQNLQLQPVYQLYIERLGAVERIGVVKYIADFQYYRPDGELIVEDVKGFKTPMYRLKKRMVAAQYGIQITEV